MTKVKTIAPHGNAYGDKYQKSAGDIYELPAEQAKGLVAQGLVERVTKDEADRSAAA